MAKTKENTLDLLNLIPEKRDTKVLVNGTIYQIEGSGVCRGVKAADAKKMLGGKGWSLWDGTNPEQLLQQAREERRAKLKAGHDRANQLNRDKQIEEKVLAQLREQGWEPLPTQEEIMEAGYSALVAQAVVEAAQAKAKAEGLMHMEDAQKAQKALQTPSSEPDLSPQPVALPPDPSTTLDTPSLSDPPPVSDPPPLSDPPPAANNSSGDSEPPQDDGDYDPPIPVGNEEWSDPNPSYSIEWLKACADAYEVKYPANIGTEKLAEKIKAAMYED